MTTLTVQGVIYTITFDGGSYTDNVFDISAGNAATGVTLDNGSQINVASGAISDQNTASGQNAEINVSSGGLSYQDSLTGASYLNDYGSVWYVSATKGGAVYAYSGSTVNSGDFGSGSVEYVKAGAADYYSDINDGYQGVTGTATGVTVENTGEQVAENGGIAYNSIAKKNGELQGWSGGEFFNFQIESGASAILYSGSSFDGGTLSGNLDVNTGATASGTLTIQVGGIISIPYADIVAQGSRAGAELLLTGTSLSLTQPTEVTLAPTGILAVGATAITFAGGGNSLVLETPLSSGIEITQGVLCFSAGTRIQTPNGGVKIEELEVGDRVSLHDGGHASIKFIGTRSYDGKFIAGQHLALPVTFHKNSIAENIPARDLIVSPGHGMFIDGVIVPAWRLVNGRSVTQAAAVERVDYLHIELANGHGILLAENCPAESYLDIGNRNQFQNAAEFYRRYPGDVVAPASCHPRIESGFLLEAVQNRIAVRGGIAAPSRRNGGLRGFIDRAGDDVGRGERVIAGWAQDPTQPEVPVILYVAVDDQPVMRILANQYRADLRAAGLGGGCHAFEVTLPRGMKGRVDVRQAVSGAILPLTEAAAAMEGSPRPLRAGHAA